MGYFYVWGARKQDEGKKSLAACKAIVEPSWANRRAICVKLLLWVMNIMFMPSVMMTSGYIAQWLERLTADQQVPGSNPGVPFFMMASELVLCHGQR